MDITDHEFTINRDDSTPIWLQIKNILLDCLAKELLQPGQIIPNERKLVDLFDASIGTIRQAVGSLEKDGILIRKQGIGTFVANHDNTSFLYKYFHVLPSGSDEKILPNVSLVSFETRKANKSEKTTLNLGDDDNRVFFIRNKLSINNKLCMVDDIVIPCAKFPLLNQAVFENRRSTVYNLYQNRFGVFITAISERIKAASATQDIADLLKMESGTPILQKVRTGYTYNNTPIEIRVSYLNTKHFEYYVPAT